MAAPPASAGEASAGEELPRRQSLSREAGGLLKRAPVRYNPEGA
jgi:hypothetical protein